MRVTRVAARFVNRIPMHLGTFGDLLASPPQLLPELADARVTAFVRRHVIQGLELDFSATLTVATVRPLLQATWNARLLEIDVSKKVDFAPVFREFIQ